MIRLLADVGGTHVRFALADTQATTPLLSDSIRRYRTADFDTLADAVRHYLKAVDEQPRVAVFALAAPVVGDEVQFTNHSWTMRIPTLREELALDRLGAINDFSAMSYGIALLQAQDSILIGTPPAVEFSSETRQTLLVIGPGTGLGVGALRICGEQIDTIASEGGHLGFAPQTPLEIAILERLQTRFGRVSNERLLCGAGLVNLHRALAEIEGLPIEELDPESITLRATQGVDRLCLRSLEIFSALLGAVAGDLVLAFGAWQGVFLTGGMIPHLVPWLQAPCFRERFEGKGRYAHLLKAVPTQAVLGIDTGLLGVAVKAMLDDGHNPLMRRARG